MRKKINLWRNFRFPSIHPLSVTALSLSWVHRSCCWSQSQRGQGTPWINRQLIRGQLLFSQMGKNKKPQKHTQKNQNTKNLKDKKILVQKHFFVLKRQHYYVLCEKNPENFLCDLSDFSRRKIFFSRKQRRKKETLTKFSFCSVSHGKTFIVVFENILEKIIRRH